MDFQIVKGKIPVIISAPHAVEHLRLGFSVKSPKPNEINTAAILKIICKKTGSWGIISTKRFIKDPNWYKKSDYRRQIEKLVKENGIRFLIDLHGGIENSKFLIQIS